MKVQPVHRPILDPGFVPAVLWNRAYKQLCAEDAGSHAFAIALERADGTISRFDTRVLPHVGENIPFNLKYVERLLKTLLWLRGGYRVTLGGEEAIAAAMCEIYSATGARKFDFEFM